jgi:hypothetical protein
LLPTFASSSPILTTTPNSPSTNSTGECLFINQSIKLRLILFSLSQIHTHNHSYPHSNHEI